MTLPLPTAVIAGVGKAGTTSLFWYLSQHPDICASDVKEIRYFTALSEGDGLLPPIAEYAGHFSGCGRQRHRLEASPQYFHGGGTVAAAMSETLPDVRVIVLLRDPIDRLWSTFRFMRTRFADLPHDMTFEAYVEECIAVRERHEPFTPENRLFRTIEGGFYDEYLDPWLEAFGERFRIVLFERMAAESAATVRDLSDWLGVDPEVADTIDYSVENKTVPVRSTSLQRLALLANREHLLGNRRKLKGPLRKAYYAINRRAEPDRMAPETRRRLDELFAPGNRALASRLRGLGYENLPAWLTADAGNERHAAR